MHTVNISGKKVQLYDTIKQMPIDRYNEMQRYILQESGIGSTMADVDGHLSNLDMYLAAERIEDARKERTNLQINLYAMLNGINFESLAFACLVHSINGKHTGYSDEDLKDTLEHLKGITVEQVTDTLNELKKLHTELEIYFPKWFKKGVDQNIEQYREYLLLKCDLVIDPDNAEAAEEMKVVCDYFIEQCKPRDFHPRSPGNEIIVSEKAHENMVLTMQEAGIKTDNMTVYDLYSRIEYFEKKYEKVKQHERNKPV